VNQLSFTPEVCEDGPFEGYVKLHWIRSAAAKRRDEKVRALAHHLNPPNLRRAFRELDGSRACGVDGVTKQQYDEKLESNLRALHDSIRCGGWRPRPSREVLIPKPQGGTRPLAIGCLEDKIVQKLTARILEAIYEPLFHRHSFGFRYGKSAHGALARLHQVIRERRKNCVVVEMDIEKFFNSVDHEWLMQKLELKIADEHFLRLIRRMLRGSILHEDGTLADTERGTPQGSPVSPVLANICLHYLLDEWFSKNHSDGGEFIRYADDAVFVFKTEQSAEAFRALLTERLAEAGLNLNLDKSGVIPFSAKAPAGVVSFLGFDFYWGRNANGERMLKLKTSSKKLNRCMKTFTDWIKAHRNMKPTGALWLDAAAKLRGHYAYFGVVFNQPKLAQFYFTCIQSLFRWLNRRSQKRSYTWAKFHRKLWFNPLPKPPGGDSLIDVTSIHHSDRNHQPKSRMREIRTSGSVRGLGWAHTQPRST
jgi:group II intron reverse transcriptase/maturase